MVQKDDHVSIIFEYKYPNSSYNTSVKKECAHKDAKSLSSMIKDNLYECKDFMIDSCILKLPDREIDVTKIISTSDLFDKTLEIVQELNADEILLEVSVIFSHEIAQCSEDESSASPMSDGEYNALHTYKTIKEGPYRNHVISTANQDYVDDKNSDTSVYLDNTRTIKSVSYKNVELVEYKYVGLVNQAMTCYLNSLLQALYMTPEFRNAVYNWEYKSLEKNIEDKSIPYQLQKLFLNLQTSSKSAVETTSLTTSFGWNYHDAWDQHDIQELCRVMFDALEQTFKNTEHADLISRLYEGKINDYVKCLTCHKEKSREDTFLDIPLPVKPFDANIAYGCVEEALEAFVKYETLEGNNQYFCEECNAMSNAHKGLKFTKFPYILTLQLKRFDFDQKSLHRIKLNDKVTFPDVLNLNSFIESNSNRKSVNHEKDADTSTKYDSLAINSSTMDKECIINNVTMSNSNCMDNPDQDDEGIDMRIGMLSSCSTYNHNTLKLREEYAAVKGPYVYELFSIMIHSGSASGGHYYAYIKDFRTKKWLCFNDQLVTPIEHTEIPKMYGSSTNRSFYSGAYRSSTNAYMLMYRQIDPERNVLPLKIEDFPIHIKTLLEKIKKSEKDQTYCEDHSNMDNFAEYIYYHHPENDNLECISISISMKCTLAQVAECAYKKANLADFVNLNECRIVSYFVDYDLVNQIYDENTRLDQLFKNQHQINFLLDIRKSKNFKVYPSDPIVTKVFLVDPVKQELIDFPKYVRAFKKQTIKEYKQELTKYFKINPDIIQLLCQAIQPNKLENDFIFESQCLSLFHICATESLEEELTFFKMSENEYLNNIITFDLDMSDFNSEQCECLKIPSFNEYKNENNQENDFSHSHVPIEEIAKLNVTSFDKYKYNNVTNMIDFQETSNSEDSSLSDSDRTLVGDVPENSDFDCELSISANKNDRINIKKCLKIIPINNSNFLKVSITDEITEDELREQLQTYLNIPKDYFRIFKKEEQKSFKIITTFTEGLKYYIRLGRIPHCDESKIDVYILDMAVSEPLQKLFTMSLKKNILIGNAKHQILTQLKQNNIKELSCEQYRFMEIKHGQLIHETMSDDEKDFKFLSEEICIQRLSDDKVPLNKFQSLVYLKKWNRSEMQLEDTQNIIINNDNFNEQLKTKISTIAEIPIEYLQFHPLDVTKCLTLENIDNCEWKSDVILEKIDLFKTYIVFRDSKQTPKILSESHKIYMDKKILFERGRMTMLTPMTSSPRKEKALKIHVHST